MDIKSTQLEPEATPLSEEEAMEYLADIEERVLESSNASMHSVLALNYLLNRLDESHLQNSEVKSRLCDLWIKIKSSGLELGDPPILFGVAENTEKSFSSEENQLDDGTEPIEVVFREDVEHTKLEREADDEDELDQEEIEASLERETDIS